MISESITIPVETEKQNLTPYKSVYLTDRENKLYEIYGKDILSTSIQAGEKIIYDYKTHPVFQGYLDAYKNHRPITISPDIIWLLIIQGFTYHVCGNATELKHMFVNFDGKKELIVDRRDLEITTMTRENWMEIFPDFTDQISKLTGEEIINTLTPDFSTTDEVSLAVGQISIMSAFKHYFEYKVIIRGCGLPFVTIEGTISDWENIKKKMQNLKKYKLDDWIDRLSPILDKIIEARKGEIDENFWKTMIRIKDDRGFYDPVYVNGWFMNFFQYDESGTKLNGIILSRNKLPSEMLVVPFKLYLAFDNTEDISSLTPIECEFLAGFVGMTQTENMSMKPKIGWIIRKTRPSKTEDNSFICFEKMRAENNWDK